MDARSGETMAAPTIEQSCFRTQGERLLFLRQRLSMTLEDAVAATGISKSELSRLENGHRRIHPEHALLLASAYGIDLASFREILQYEPKIRLSKVQGEPQRGDRVRLPVHNEAAFAEGRGEPHDHLDLALPVALSPAAYGIRIGKVDADVLIRKNAVVIADPGARTVIGDLVVNTLTLNPVFMTLERDDQGTLIGSSIQGRNSFPAAARMKDFHKVVIVLPASHLFSA